RFVPMIPGRKMTGITGRGSASRCVVPLLSLGVKRLLATQSPSSSRPGNRIRSSSFIGLFLAAQNTDRQCFQRLPALDRDTPFAVGLYPNPRAVGTGDLDRPVADRLARMLIPDHVLMVELRFGPAVHF